MVAEEGGVPEDVPATAHMHGVAEVPERGLIMSAVSRLFPCELDPQTTGESLPRLMVGAPLPPGDRASALAAHSC